MNKDTVLRMLPVITAFAEGRRIQHRSMYLEDLFIGWVDVNPNTTEFRLTDELDPNEWRIKTDL